MKWYMNEEREVLVKAFREFVEKEIRPFVPKMEENEEYPKEILSERASLEC